MTNVTNHTGKFLGALFGGDDGRDIPFEIGGERILTDDAAFIAENEGKLRVYPADPEGIFFLFAAKPETAKNGWEGCLREPTVVLWKDGTSVYCWKFQSPVQSDQTITALIDYFGMGSVEEAIPLPGTDSWELVYVNEDNSYLVEDLADAYLEPVGMDREPEEEGDSEDEEVASSVVDDGPEPVAMYGEARVITPYDESKYEGKTIALAIGGNQYSKDWVPQKMPLDGLIHFFTKHQIGKKDGLAVVFADMVRGQRLKKAVKACTAIGLDIDTGTPSAVVDRAIAKLGCLAFRTTTHSHGRQNSDLNKDRILRFRPEADEIDTDLCQDFLRNKEFWDESIVKTVKFIEEEHTEKGIVVRVSHAPMPKHRVIVPIENYFVIGTEGRTQQEAMSKWAKVPEALATRLAVPFDRSCTDPSRLFYTPRHDKGKPYEVSLFGGPLFNLDDLGLTNVFDAVATEIAKNSKKSMSVTEGGRALGNFWKTTAHGFQIMDVIEQYAPDRKRSKATNGYNIECPFDEDHSNSGDTSDQACFAVNAADGPSEYFVIKCQHETCKDKTALDMLGKMLKDEWFDREVLDDESFNIAEPDEIPTTASVLRDKNSADTGVSDGYGGALAFDTKKGPRPKGVSFDKETNQVHATFRNALLLIGHEGWDLGYNELTQQYGMRGEVLYPWPEHLGYVLNDALRREIRLYLLRRWGVTFSTEAIFEATMTLARRNNFNPVCEYLDEVEAKWDGRPRVERWLETYMGVKVTLENANYVRSVGKIPLVAAVRRARHPGCKFDELLTLEGPQGGGKSTAIGILGGEFYSDAKLGDLENTQKVGMKLRGTWIQEFGELAGLNKAEVDDVKDFLSKRADRFKQPYGRSEDDYPRRCIFIGTVNPGGSAYLADLTGNRRFWPVVCGYIDLEALARDRDQLWAEAATMESRGDPIRLDPSLYDIAKSEQDARLADDPWVEILADYLEGLEARGETRVLSMTLLRLALELPIERQTQASTRKLKGAMALIPTWEYKATIRSGGRRSSGYEFIGA